MSDDTHNENDADDARENVNERESSDDAQERESSGGGAQAATGGTDERVGEGDDPKGESEELERESSGGGAQAATGGTDERVGEGDDPEGGARIRDDVARAALETFDGLVWHDSHGQSVLYVPREHWLDLAIWLRDEQGFEICADICGVDHLLNGRRPVPAGVEAKRFEVVANFLSMSENRRLRALCEVPGDDATVASLTPVYPGVDYSERETYDLFGIVFEGHPDLTRILLPEDWEGWPLRKDDAAARVPVQFKGTASTPDQQSLKRQQS